MANTLNLGNGNWATKEDSLLAYNSENGNFKPLAFNFTRASSATVVNKAGLIETVGSGEPRIDFSNDAKGALLLEPTRSNLIPYSNNLTNWNGAVMTTTLVDDLINPSNGLDASKLTQTSSGGYAWLSRTFTGNETFSAFVKKDSSNFVRLYAGGNSVYFNILNGTIETISGSVEDKSIIDYGNGWFRISISVNSTAASYVRIYPASSGSSSSGTNSLFVYGAQLEQGSYATSYIPTQGSAVTRVAESCSQTVPSGIIGQTEGTVFLDVDFKTLSGTNMFVSIRPDASNKIEIYRTDAAIYGEFASDASFNFNKPSVTVGRYKIAVAYSSGSSAMYINGVLIGSNTTPFAFTSTLDGIYINSRGTTFIEQSSYNDVKLYNTRLSNAELQALTSN